MPPLPLPPSTTTTTTATKSGGGNINNIVDPKLFHLVKKLTTNLTTTEQGGGENKNKNKHGNNSNSKQKNRNNSRKINHQQQQQQEKPNIDNIVTVLRTQHREYMRKDLRKLTSQVRAAVEQIVVVDDNDATTTTTNNNGVARKRKQQQRQANEDDDDDEDEEAQLEALYDKEAAEHDSRRERSMAAAESNTASGGSLNAALRNRYKRVATTIAASSQQEESPAAATTRRGSSASAPASLPTPVRQDDEPSSSTAAGPALLTVTIEDTAADDVMKSPSGTPSVKREEQQQQQQQSNSKLRAGTAVGGSSTGKRSKSGSGGSTKMRRLSRSLSSTGQDNGMAAGGVGGAAAATFLSPVSPRPTERYSDLGGMSDVILQLRQLVEYPLTRPELYRHLGVDPPRGVLLRGPPGTGKTHLANAVAGEMDVPYFRVSAPELVSGMSGESEGRIRDLFRSASDIAPSIIFLDELDAIAPKRGGDSGSGPRGMEKRMVAQLLTSMDSIAPSNNRNGDPVLVLAATNRPDALDQALRRAGRFDKEILLGVPDEGAREKILRSTTRNMRLSGDFDFKLLARKTPGFVGADVQSLAKEAAVLAIDRIFHSVLNDRVLSSSTEQQKQVGDDSTYKTGTSTAQQRVAGGGKDVKPLTADQMEPLYISMEDFVNAVPLVQPSAKREGFATAPDVTWDDIGALAGIREELSITVLEPIRNPEKFEALGLTLPAGVLLYGPPGCGKTLLAKAIANESGANFIAVKGPELLDKYVGESERAVRLVFERARSSSPCIVFFDELDSLVPKRGSDSGGGGVSERVVNQLLTELDGLDSRRSVYVIAATNRPELIDPAMMRPGRLDKLLYVPLPTPQDRVSILKALAVNVVMSEDVDLEVICMSNRAKGYSGADCAALLREAGLAVLKEDAAAVGKGQKQLCIAARHFDQAYRSVMPSVSKKDQSRYDRIRDRMARARSRSVADEEEATETVQANTVVTSSPVKPSPPSAATQPTGEGAAN